jgi:hypothetical protein
MYVLQEAYQGSCSDVRGELGGVKNLMHVLNFFSYPLNDSETAKRLLDCECPDLAAERKKPIRSVAHAALRRSLDSSNRIRKSHSLTNRTRRNKNACFVYCFRCFGVSDRRTSAPAFDPHRYLTSVLAKIG